MSASGVTTVPARPASGPAFRAHKLMMVGYPAAFVGDYANDHKQFPAR